MAAEDAKASLLDQALAKGGRSQPRCTIAKILNAHPDLAEQITELLENSGEGNGKGISYATSGDILSTAVGEKVEGQTISRHNRRRCSCS